MSFRRINRWIILGLLAIISPNVFGYSFTQTPEKKNIYWPERYIPMVGNPSNQNGLSPEYFFQAVTRGLFRWKEASLQTIQFDYWQGTDSREYEPNSESNGHSSIYFVSRQNAGNSIVSPNVVAVTQVWYQTDSGRIQEADIVLNDRDYVFTNNPTDTSGFGSGNNQLSNRVFFENVMTHELGHVMGLSHSGHLQSSMFFMEAPDQTHLSCDDRTGIQTVLLGGSSNGNGNLQGRVVQSGIGVGQVHVSAISIQRGTVMGAASTDTNGMYWIGGLAPGDYAIMIEPNSRRVFLTQGNSHQIQTIRVHAGQTSSVPEIQSNGVIPGPLGTQQMTSAPALTIGSGGSVWIDRAGSFGASTYYRVTLIGGNYHFRGIGYSLFSPVRMELALLDSLGNEISSQHLNPVYVSESGFKNHDSELEVQSLQSGQYFLRVRPILLSSNHFPAGSLVLDPVPFFMIQAMRDTEIEATHPKCRSSETFPEYQSPPGGPPRGSGGGVGFCGTIQSAQEQGVPPSLREPTPPGAVFGWFLPWAAMGVIFLVFKVLIKLEFRLRSVKRLVNFKI